MSMNKIKCRLCDDEHNVKQFGMHVSRKHKMKYADYAKLYWEDLPNWSPCKVCGNVSKNVYCSVECLSKGVSVKYKGIVRGAPTDTHRENLSKSIKKWYSNNEHPWVGRTHSKEALKKMSQAQRYRFANPENHGMYGKTHKISTLEKMSKARVKYFEENDSYLKGKTYIEYYGKDRAAETIKKIFQNKPMNKLEKKVGDYLTELGIDYTFQFFINEDGVCKSYDFKINNTNLILEVHGDYWHGGVGINKHVFNVDENIQNDKLKTEIANRRGYEVVVVWESEIKDDIDIIRKRIKL
jgi:G:T-mismatch repair DNA endonuclease (very short patch repair protein)